MCSDVPVGMCSDFCPALKFGRCFHNLLAFASGMWSRSNLGMCSSYLCCDAWSGFDPDMLRIVETCVLPLVPTFALP